MTASSEGAAASEDARWSVWFYRRGSWTGRWVHFGNAEGCTRTLLIGTPWTGFIVFGLWRIRFDPDCPECVGRRNPCQHEWTHRSQGPGFRWRECWLCGEMGDYE